ncbi:MAG: glycerol-3-phosphate dehydrogenase, partial [Pseudonocardiaceae bacterium]
ISIEYSHRGEACAAEVADLMAGVLNWTVAARDREVQFYLARVAAERDSQRAPDDSAADARRAAAPDPRLRLLIPVS